VDNSLSTELSASKYYKPTYAQESVDKVGQNPWISRWWPAGGRWPRPPLGRLGGGDCGGTKQLQKKFFKKVTTNANCAKMSTPQNYGVTNANETSDSHNQGPRVDRLRHWWGERRKDVLHADESKQYDCLARMGQYQRYSGDNMNIALLTKVRQLFNVDYVPRSTNRHNQKQYIKAIRLLGDKWLTHPHNKIQRIQWLLFILLLRWMFYSLLGWCGNI
jgi:hypothetical protein